MEQELLKKNFSKSGGFIVKEKKRKNKVSKQYNEEEIFRKLKEKYGRINCIRIKKFIYIVYENNTYYLMKSITDIFDISRGIKLTKVVEIKEDSDESITAKIRRENENILVVMLKSDIINELTQWV